MVERPKVGDYVLATKYDDGDPCDHFYVGFVLGYTDHGRFLVRDNNGQNQRANGFRRAEKITDEEGQKLIALMPFIGDTPGKSLWWHLNKIRGYEEPVDPMAEEIREAHRLRAVLVGLIDREEWDIAADACLFLRKHLRAMNDKLNKMADEEEVCSE